MGVFASGGRRAQSLLAAVALLAGTVLGACTGESSVPVSPTASGQAPTDSLERTIRSFLDAGATAAVVQVRWPGGEWTRSYGVRDLDGSAPARTDDRVSIGSVTMSMVAVSVLKMAGDGLIGLDDPVNAMLPGFTSALRPPGPITVRQLLNHTSGMPDFTPAHDATGAPKQVLNTPLTLQRGLELAATLPWEARSVGSWAFSTSNYYALGELIEKLRGKPVGEVLKEDIFAPLGLDKTSLAAPDRAAPDNIHAYITDAGERVDVTQPGDLAGSPAGGVVSTVEDVNDFYRALLSGKLVPPAALEQMKQPTFFGYGLGLGRWDSGCSGSGYRYGHWGTVYGYLTGSISSADGGSQATMTLVAPPLPAASQDEGSARRLEFFAGQLESALQETLDRLCQ